ncbi:MAG: phytanoyl-CoA dioxygenase family protein [Candidatus Poribacteria bacterium]|nr:phytanoyl-CoA dioxygenase family protein [Candidatus Poribacteria bacterium]
MHLTNEQIRQYKETGFVVVPGLFDSATVQQMIEHYMKRRAEGPKPGDTGGTTDHPEDPNHKYPRMINMHNWDELTKRWATAAGLLEVVEALIGDKSVLLQTMLYFKPPGARGQGLHQDEQYITIDPLIGVWVALDKSDKAVGQMVVVPGSHKYGLSRVEAADTSISFTQVQAVMPADAEVLGVDMEPGDALFFDGKAIHGSYMNETSDRWRRSFICHYVGEHSKKFEPPPGKHVSHLRS